METDVWYQIRSSCLLPPSEGFSVFHQVLSETSSSKVGSYRLFSFCSRQSPEMKQSGLGRCHNALLSWQLCVLMTVWNGSKWERNGRRFHRWLLVLEDTIINGSNTFWVLFSSCVGQCMQSAGLCVIVYFLSDVVNVFVDAFDCFVRKLVSNFSRFWLMIIMASVYACVVT